jgi:hypothetical protein
VLGSGTDQADKAVAIHWSQVLDNEQVLNREELKVLQDNARHAGFRLQKGSGAKPIRVGLFCSSALLRKENSKLIIKLEARR